MEKLSQGNLVQKRGKKMKYGAEKFFLDLGLAR